MIILEETSKDTYVTNLLTSYNNGENANLGRASTIDLFKISGDKSALKARSLLTVNLLPQNGDKIFLRDSSIENNGSAISFIFDTTSNTVDGSLDLNGNVIIGTLDAENDTNAITTAIETTINNVSTFEANNIVLNVTAKKSATDKIVITQDTSGSSGIKNNSSDSERVSLTNFFIFEHSAALLSFDLDKIKNEHILDKDQSIFNKANSFKVFLRLHDVGNSFTKPRNFSLKINALKNEFIEGLGKDTIHFSDHDLSNFKSINNQDEWTINSFVSDLDCVSLNNGNIFESQCVFESGSEDAVFDITDYFSDYISGNVSSQSFVISFDYEYLFNENSYFVKRFASKDSRDRTRFPRIEVKLADDLIEESIYMKSDRFVDNEEIFYLLNKATNGKTKDFLDDVDLHLTDGENFNPASIRGTDVYSYSGKKLTGLKKFVVPNNVVTLNNQEISDDIEASGESVITFNYKYVGNQITIASNTVKFTLPDTSISNEVQHLRPVINIPEKYLYANDNIQNIVVDFVDTKKQYESKNVKIDLISEDIGDVYYEVYDVDENVELIKSSPLDWDVDPSTESTRDDMKLKYLGNSYVLKLFCSSLFKNKRVRFNFVYENYLTGIKRKITCNTIVRFI